MKKLHNIVIITTTITATRHRFTPQHQTSTVKYLFHPTLSKLVLQTSEMLKNIETKLLTYISIILFILERIFQFFPYLGLLHNTWTPPTVKAQPAQIDHTAQLYSCIFCHILFPPIPHPCTNLAFTTQTFALDCIEILDNI